MNSLSVSLMPLFLFCVLSGTLSEAYAAPCDEGATLYADLCARCHGDHGAGDGVDSADIPTQYAPRDFSLGRFKVGVCQKKLHSVIKYGGAAMGLSAAMPSFKNELCGGLPLNDTQIEALVQYILGLGESP